MIPLTRLDGAALIVNLDQIAWIECSPDTVIALSSGDRLIVRESVDEVVARAIRFKRSVLSIEPTALSNRTAGRGGAA